MIARREARARLLRHAVAFAIAPLSVPVLAIAADLVRVATMRVPAAYASAQVRETIVFAATKLAPLACAGALVLGVPILLALRRAQRMTLPWVATLSAGVGAIASGALGVAVTLAEDGSGCASATPAEALVAGLAVGGVAGAWVGAVHCAVARVPLRRARPGPAAATSRASP